MRWWRKRRGRRPGAPQGAPRCFFGGVCTCRAGPMCPAAGYAFFGGAHGPRPTGRYVEPPVGDGVPTSRQRGGAALLGPLWEGAVGAADWGREKRVASLPPSALRADTSLSEGGEERRIPTPVTAGHTGPALQGAAVIQGGRSRPPVFIRPAVFSPPCPGGWRRAALSGRGRRPHSR